MKRKEKLDLKAKKKREKLQAAKRAKV